MMSVALTGLRDRQAATICLLQERGKSLQRAAAQGFHGNGLSDDGLRGQTEGYPNRESDPALTW